MQRVKLKPKSTVQVVLDLDFLVIITCFSEKKTCGWTLEQQTHDQSELGGPGIESVHANH